MDYDSAVVNSTALPKRCAHDQDRHKPSRRLHDGGQPPHDRIEKRILQQKIFWHIPKGTTRGIPLQRPISRGKLSRHPL
jgi:hypothetical protein